MKACACIAYCCIIGAVLALSCSKPDQVSGIEITNGNCLGKIYNPDGTASKGALVKLIPMDYNPYSQKNESIDSTLTDANGSYAFTVSEQKYYNIVAEKGSSSCMLDSIFVQAEAKTMVDNDTLRQSGWLSGAIRLKPGDDGSQVVILVLGTSVYTVPSDTSGSFTSPPLPQGSYSIQIFTTLAGYAIFDTLVSVRSGAGTPVSLTLPSANAPSIAQFAAIYDSVSMHSVLSWSMPDTSKIVSYALYRKSARGRDTMFLVDKSATTFSDDVVGFDGDSVSYRIAGIGTNYKEGYRSSPTQPIVVCGIVYCIKKTDLTRVMAGLFSLNNISVFSDQENEIFLVGDQGIFKLDSMGNAKKDFRLDFETGWYKFLTGNLQSDNNGHLYISQFNNYDSVTLITFDRDLSVLSRRVLPCGIIIFDKDQNVGGQQYLPSLTFEVLSGGAQYAFSAPGRDDIPVDWGTSIKVYDSAFSIQRNFSIADRAICGAGRFGDTMVTYEYHYGQTTGDRPLSIHFYDAAFAPLSIANPMDSCPKAWSNPRFETVVRYNKFFAVQSGVFVSIFDALNINSDNTALLVFTNAKGDLLGRIVVPRGLIVSFDSRGNMYFVEYESTPDGMRDMCCMEKLFTYTMMPLLKKNNK
jgi:hypothetical protein